MRDRSRVYPASFCVLESVRAIQKKKGTMDDQPQIGGPNDDEAAPAESPRTIDERFGLTDALSIALNEHFLAEQWLQNIGVRDIITGIGSADVPEFMRGVRQLQRLLETRFTEGVARGRHDYKPTSQRMLFVGMAVGAIVTAILIAVAAAIAAY